MVFMGVLSAVADVVSRATVTDWLLVLAAVVIAIYLKGTWSHDHFSRHGVPQVKGLWPFFGSMGPLTIGTESLSDFILRIYGEFKDRPMFGVFQFQNPVLVLNDLDLIKAATVKDFDHFIDHPPITSKKLNPVLNQSLLNLEGQEWRDMRATLSPAFTSSKMKNMFKLIDDCGKRTVQFIDEKISSNPDAVLEQDMKDFFSRFTNDCIATSAFGIKVDSLNDRDNEFYKKGYELTQTKGLRSFYLLLFLFVPRLCEFFGLSFISNSAIEFFHRIVHSTIREREKKGIFRPDMLQLLIQARSGELKVDKADEHEKETLVGEKKILTDEDISGQAVIFFFAGFDTVSTLMCYTSISLVYHPDVQQRLQREIDEVFDTYGGALTYEALNEMKYLDMILNEVQRMYSGAATDRRCVKDYTFPAKDGIPAYTIRKGEIIWILQHALHHDPEHWTDPEKFDPERFSDENKSNIKPYAFLPFGLGPRICIGSRFALMETKIALAHILRRFSFVATPKTPRTVRFAKMDFSVGIEGGFWVGFQRRKD